jgi:hypothetical protein
MLLHQPDIIVHIAVILSYKLSHCGIPGPKYKNLSLRKTLDKGVVKTQIYFRFDWSSKFLFRPTILFLSILCRAFSTNILLLSIKAYQLEIFRILKNQ